MPSDTPADAIFVSCDLIGHGETGDHEGLLVRVRGLNDCLKRVCGAHFSDGVIWASGGDGGHMCFLGVAYAPLAISLLETLFAWAHEPDSDGAPRAKLRLTAHYGPVAVIEGADGRRELVGDGINVCGSLLRFGEPDTVLVSSSFRDLLRECAAKGDPAAQRAKFSADRTVYLKHSRATFVTLMSLDGAFKSVAAGAVRSDRSHLERTLGAGDFWTAIYHAKRLLQVDSADADATAALQTITPSQLVVTDRASSRVEAHPLLAQMNRQSMHDLVRAAQLVERDDAEVICAEDDPGDAMFIVVKGRIGVVLAEDPSREDRTPFDVSFAAGQIVGELALALNRRRTATLQAIGPTAFLSISYETLRSLLDAKPVNTRLQRAFNEFLLDRSLRFLCGQCSYLAAGESAPLAGVNQPWESLIEGSEQLKLDWRDADALLASDDRFAGPGVYILAGGRLLQATQSDVVVKRLDAKDLPIAFVDLPNMLVSNNHAYRIDPESGTTVNIVRIADGALKAFGPTIYAKLVAAIRRQLAQQFLYDVFISYSHHDEHIAVTWRTAMERAGLRVYMGVPDAMRKFKPEIELALSESLVMAPFVSDRAMGAEGQAGWVQREIEYRKTLFDEDHCNILPIELTKGLSETFADGFSSIVVSGDGSRDVAEVIEAIQAVRKGTRAPPFAAKRNSAQRI